MTPTDTYEAAMERLQQVLDAPVPCRAPDKQHMCLKARTIAATDAGEFEAIISTGRVDREKDIVLPEAMVRALRAWADLDKLVPLAWEHNLDPENLIGHIDPATVKAVGDEVTATGWVDQSTDRGGQVWRLVKSGTLSFSFGYLINDSVKRPDGVRELREIDVYEVSAVAAPMNADTRVTSWKSVEDDRDDDREPPSLDELRARERALDLDGTETLRREIAAHLCDIMTAATNDTHSNGSSTHPDDAKTLRARAEKTARECGPITVAMFECE